MAVRKLTQDEWAYEINRALQVRDVQRQKLSQTKFHYFDQVIRRLLPLPYIIAAIAIFLLIYLFGWTVFFEFFLSWCVSLTLVATGSYYVWKYYEKHL